MKGMGSRLLAVVVALVAAASACNGESTGTIGSETNWLGSCNSDDDCEGARCLCGVCSQECTASADCEGGQLVCVAKGTDAHTRVCAVDQAPNEGLCLKACPADGNCGAAMTCVDDACVPAPTRDDGGSGVGSDVGTPCVPYDEGMATFGGFSANEVVIEDTQTTCSSGVCLVNHFQGRVTCPYGVDCLTPDGATVSSPVPAQLVERAPADNVFCTCGCDGPAEAGPFCACPDGFVCQQVIEDLGLGYPATHYCVNPATFIGTNPAPGGATCDPALANCENR